MADRAHTLLSKGYNVIQDRLEPEVREQVGGALQTYSTRRNNYPLWTQIQGKLLVL